MSILEGSAFTLVLVSILSTVICESIGKGSMYSSIKTVCSLCVLLSLFSAISPIFKIIGSFDGFDPDGESLNIGQGSYENTVIDKTKETVEKYVSELIAERFEVSSDDIIVTATLDSSDKTQVRIKNLTVKLHSLPSYPPEVILEVLKNELMCKITLLLPE